MQLLRTKAEGKDDQIIKAKSLSYIISMKNIHTKRLSITSKLLIEIYILSLKLYLLNDIVSTNFI